MHRGLRRSLGLRSAAPVGLRTCRASVVVRCSLHAPDARLPPPLARACRDGRGRSRRARDHAVPRQFRIRSAPPDDPFFAVREETLRAALRAALAAGTLALRRGRRLDHGVPEMISVWRLQRSWSPTSRGCTGARHGDAGAVLYFCSATAPRRPVRDLAVRTGERLLVRQASVRVIRAAPAQGRPEAVAACARQRRGALDPVPARCASRYAYLDTREVGRPRRVVRRRGRRQAPPAPQGVCRHPTPPAP